MFNICSSNEATQSQTYEKTPVVTKVMNLKKNQPSNEQRSKETNDYTDISRDKQTKSHCKIFSNYYEREALREKLNLFL